MFAKLLKHEFKAVWNYLGVLCLGALVASVMGGVAMRYLIGMSEEMEQMEGTALEIISVFVMVGAFLAIGVCAVGGFLMLMLRFYRSRFTDEGYLMFTLPVNTHQILLSSVVSTLLNLLILFLVVLGAGVLLLLIGMSGTVWVWQEFIDCLPQLWEALGRLFNKEVLKLLGAVTAAGIAGSIWEVICLMLAITLGALAAKKHKILAAVGFYYGIHMVDGMVKTGFLVASSMEQSDDVLWAMLLRPSILSLALAIGGYFLMWYLTDRKLNLP